MMKVKSCVIAATIIAMTTGVSVAQTSEAQSNAGNGSVNPIESMPPIARAVVDDDRKAIAALLKEEPSAINDTVRAKKGERAGYTPLILATALSNPDMAKYLIDHGAEITKVDDYNRSAFWYAAFNGNTELTEILVDSAKAPIVSKVINVPDRDFMRTPLHLAVRRNDPALVQVLLKAGASEDFKDASGETPSDFCKRNHTRACKELLK